MMDPLSEILSSFQKCLLFDIQFPTVKTVIHLFSQGVVTSAASLIQGVVHDYADDYKGCVQLAVSRLSRVSF